MPASAKPWEPEFDWLTDGLAVGGCFPIADAVHMARPPHSIAAIIDLREEDRDNDRLLRDAGIAFLHLPTPDMFTATGSMLDEGVAFARAHLDRDEKVLIHCQHGIGRSALLALCVMVDQGMAPLDALEQAKTHRRRVSPSQSQYEGWCDWLRRNGHPVPSYHDFGCIAYRHLANH
jgi:protein-tyrosine phosphatase